MALTLELEKDRKKVKRQIAGLKWELMQDDIPDMDRKIFEQSLAALQKHLEQMDEGTESRMVELSMD